MRVAFVTGPVSAGHCGIGDYTRLLAAAIERKGVRAAVFESSGPPALRAFRLRAETKSFQPDVTHLQYPTPGFGRGITPHLFSFLTRLVLTLHEVEGTHLLRRLSLFPLYVRAQHVIFTCESNREYSLRWAPWLRRVSSVVPLSSNIPVVANLKNGQALAEVIHFGLIRPNKGIEDVLEFARLARAEQLPVRVRIVGNSPATYADYLVKIQAASAALSVTWDLNLSAEAVAERLAQATIAYMPFPDGASERHASLLAALANGVPVVTTKGKFTPPGMESAARFCATLTEALASVKELLGRPDLQQTLRANALQYAGKLSWESVAESHIKIYEQIVA
jgi:glycosyltransferase involved in cell wall biosynthesis